MGTAGASATAGRCSFAYVRSLLIAVAAGVAGVLVPAIGAALASQITSDGIGGIYAATVNFLGGLLVSVAGATLHAPACGAIRFRDFRWFNWLGGLFGAIFVTGSILLSRRIGLALFFVLVFAGMLFISLVFDKRGFLVFPKRPVKPVHLVAAGIVLAGLLVVQEPQNWGDQDTDATTAERVGYALVVFMLGWNNPVQAAVNRSTGACCPSPYWSMVLSFAGASLIMLAASAIQMAAVAPVEFSADVRWYHFCGGVFGPIFVGGAIVATPVLGACTYYCVLVGTQLATSFLFDSVGALGYKQKDPSPMRIIGALLTLSGVVLYSVMQPIPGKPAPPAEAASADAPPPAETGGAAPDGGAADLEMSDVEVAVEEPGAGARPAEQ